MLGIFLTAIEATVVSTAMPTVVSSLGGLHLYPWVFSSYLLSFTVSLPLWGKCSDLWGRKKVILGGIAGFLAASVLCGLAPSMPFLVVSRALQGIAGGAILPVGLAVVGEIYSLEMRAKMQGLFSAVWGIASVAGPLVGGTLTAHVSWRAIFFLMLPFGAIASLLLGLGLEEPARRTRHRLDVAGAVVLSAAMILLLLLLTMGGRTFPWISPAAIALAAGSLLLLGLFLLVESRAAEPVLELALFRSPIFTAATLVGLFSGMCLYGAASFVPLFVQGVGGTGPVGAGGVLTPLSVAWVLTAAGAGWIMLRTGVRVLTLTGMVFLVGGFVWLVLVGSGTGYGEIIGAMALTGIGMGLSAAPLLIAVQGSVEPGKLGMATSANTFFRTLGGALGVGVMGGALNASLASRLAAMADRPGVPEGVARLAREPNLLLDPLGRMSLPAADLAAVREALASALHLVFLIGLVCAVLSAFSALLVPRFRGRDLGTHSPRGGGVEVEGETAGD
jgi:EmrB/QacA subfamily drug resistance transporter